MYNKIAIKSQ